MMDKGNVWINTIQKKEERLIIMTHFVNNNCHFVKCYIYLQNKSFKNLTILKSRRKNND